MVYGTGLQREWHDNGQLKIEVSTVSGKFCGRNRIWLNDGSLASERYYLHGTTVSRAEYLRARRDDSSLPAIQDSTPWKRLRSSAVIERRSHETCVAAMLERVPRSEARQWFGEAKRSAFPSLGRFRTARSALDFVESLYTAGAQEVVVPDIYRDRKGREYADWLLVRLPRAAKMRQRIRRACGLLKKQTLGAFLPKRDLGESHLFLVLE